MNIYTIISTILWIVGGFLVTYIKSKKDIIEQATSVIDEAEKKYADMAKAGSDKMLWAVEFLYSKLPEPMKFFITKDFIRDTLQKTFDSVASYATQQLDKLVDKKG